MRLTRVYVEAPLAPGARLSLTGSAAGHLIRVLRLRPGDALTLFNGQGGEHAAAVTEVRGGKLAVQVGAASATERESALAVTLAQGVSRGERMDLVVQKATELGVARIVPLFTERSVVRLSAQQGERKLAHWRGIVIAACEQSGRNRLPELVAPLALAEFLARSATGASRIVLSPGAATRVPDLPRTTAVTLLIGPEGGLTEDEQQGAVRAGFTAVRLGPRILRTETAALAALSVLQREFGDF